MLLIVLSTPTVIAFQAETVKNALAYHTEEWITPVKSFLEQAPGNSQTEPNVIKRLRFVIKCL